MNRFKMAIKAAVVPAIIGLVMTVVGVIIFIIGIAAYLTGLFLTGIFIAVIGIGVCAYAYGQGKQRLHAICPECQKFMGDTDKEVSFSYVINEYKPHYDKEGKLIRNTYYYNCSVVCPHCGNSVMFNDTINAKSESEANTAIHKYLQNIFKLKK